MTLNEVKTALRITTDEFDGEITMLMNAAAKDLEIAGVTLPSTLDDIVNTAICTYVKLHFGNPDNYDRLERSYKEQKAQLTMASGYTTWV